VFSSCAVVNTNCLQLERVDRLQSKSPQGNQTRQRPQRSQSRAEESSFSFRPRLRFLAALLAFLPILHAEEAPVKSSPKGIETAFASTLTKLKVQPSETTITAEWEYTNHWDAPLAVERFETSCGCLAGNTEQRILEPGESGKITATFTPGQHRGLLRKSLHIRFVGHDKPVELVVEASIPSHVEISTQELSWESGVRTVPRTVDLTSGTGKAFTITALQGLPENQFTLTQETLTQGTHHRITITPSADAILGSHTLQIHTDSPDPRDQVKAVFLQIVAGTSSPSPLSGHPVPIPQAASTPTNP